MLPDVFHQLEGLLLVLLAAAAFLVPIGELKVVLMRVIHFGEGNEVRKSFGIVFVLIVVEEFEE